MKPCLDRYKFLHAADIHLDSPLRGLSRYEGVPAEEVRLATRAALDNLVMAAIEEEVAFVIIAGDIYDGDWPDFGTGLFFCAAMGRLAQAGIGVFLLYGNHDAESVLTRKLPLPVGVQVFDTRRAGTLFHQATATALHGWSYRERDTRDNLASAYPPPLANHLNIGVLHTALNGGRPPHAPYAPCTPQQLAAKGYGYWALGHVHEFELVSAVPPIVFPGNLQGRNIRECGRKGAVVVSVEDGQVVGPPRPIALDAVRWARVDVDVAGVHAEAELHARLRDALGQAHEDHAEGRPLMARVTIGGRTALHGALHQRRDALREEVRAIAVAISAGLWIEKVALNTVPPVVSDPVDPTLRDELGSLLAQGATDPGLAAVLNAELQDFLARTPPDLGADDELLTALRRGEVAALLQEAAAALDARLATVA
jgi:exonuclease SbcD